MLPVAAGMLAASLMQFLGQTTGQPGLSKRTSPNWPLQDCQLGAWGAPLRPRDSSRCERWCEGPAARPGLRPDLIPLKALIDRSALPGRVARDGSICLNGGTGAGSGRPNRSAGRCGFMKSTPHDKGGRMATNNRAGSIGRRPFLKGPTAASAAPGALSAGAQPFPASATAPRPAQGIPILNT